MNRNDLSVGQSVVFRYKYGGSSAAIVVATEPWREATRRSYYKRGTGFVPSTTKTAKGVAIAVEQEVYDETNKTRVTRWVPRIAMLDAIVTPEQHAAFRAKQLEDKRLQDEMNARNEAYKDRMVEKVTALYAALATYEGKDQYVSRYNVGDVRLTEAAVDEILAALKAREVSA